MSSPTHDRALANALPQIIWTCDAAGQLEWVNDRWTELTGLSVEESRDKGAMEAMHPGDREDVTRRFAEALATGSPCELEYRIRNRAGQYRYYFCRVAPVRGDGGAVVRWVAAAFDVHDRRVTEEALRQSEQRFEAIFRSTPQSTTITRLADGVFVDANDAFLRLSGYTRDELLGKSAAALGMAPPEQRAPFIARLRESTSADHEVSFPTKSGRLIDLQIRSVMCQLAGEPCIVTTSSDVTERRATEAALRENEALARERAHELETLMEAVPAAVWIAQDPACREVRSNGTGREILRIAEGENLSKTALDPTPTRHFKVVIDGREIAPEDLPLQRAARGAEVRDYDEEIHFDDGSVRHLYGSAVPLRDPSGTPRGAIGAFVDVTRLRAAEAAMREADRRKDEFLALLSHELRNPLAPILNAAELLQQHGDGGPPGEPEVILRQARHLVRLVDDLLDVSRVASGKVTLSKRPLELAGVVAKALEASRPLLERRRHRVEVAVPSEGLVVDADEVRLTQIVSNLLSNAARYTPAGGLVEVGAAREGDDVVLRVRDDGVGIEPSLLPYIFDTFVQGARGPDRADGGLGLGLSLVRTLTVLHGGTVEARSEGPGRGSELVVRLPASRAAAAPFRAAASERTGAREHPRRILVVDDNRDGAAMVSSLLGRAGHDVRVAHDPEQALSLASDFRPEVAILDIGLPVMDGYALGRELRARLAETPPLLIALTGYGQEQDKRRSERAGFVRHLAKPVDAETLGAVVDSLLE
jgi:PAS domain S-box-containing protein